MPKSVLFDREAVMDKVTNLFWRKGYNGTSMQDLVDVTGLNRSSFYNSFGDKLQLYKESLKHYQQMQNQMLQSFFADAASPGEALRALFQGICEEIMTDKERKGCFLSNCTAELGSVPSHIRDFLVANKESVISSFATLIRQAQETGEIDPKKDPDTLALYLFSSLQGLRVTSMIEPDITGVINEILKSL